MRSRVPRRHRIVPVLSAIRMLTMDDLMISCTRMSYRTFMSYREQDRMDADFMLALEMLRRSFRARGI